MNRPRSLRGNRRLPAERASFRDWVAEVPSTTYASHGMYYYPARFIPQVVRWSLNQYSRPGDWVLDPFAGSGTVAVESLLTGRNSLSLDLSPMLGPLVAAKTYRGASWEDLERGYRAVTTGRSRYRPPWSRIGYWHPPELLDTLGQLWEGYHDHPHPLLLIALLRTTRRFSYADAVVPKLFKSRRKTAEITRMVRGDYRRALREDLRSNLEAVYAASRDFERRYRGGRALVRERTDLLEYTPRRRVRLVLTSPPYGIAHEYIRSVKLELAWMGLTDSEITDLTHREIPYRSPPPFRVNSPTYEKLLPRIEGPARKNCERYFASILFVLGRVLGRIEPGGHAALFVGNATFAGVEMPYAQIFWEHLGPEGYAFERLLEDPIRGHRLFRGRRNRSPDGIAVERLLVLRREAP